MQEKHFYLSVYIGYKVTIMFRRKKYTTCSRRVFETDQAVDLVYDCEEMEIKNLVCNYPYKGEWYGIDKTEILHEINHGNIPVIIVRSFEIIHKIKKDFDDVRVFFIVGASGAILKEKLLQQGRQVNDIDASDDGVETIIGEYVANIEDIDYCILNCLYNEELYIKQCSYPFKSAWGKSNLWDIERCKIKA